MKKLSAAALLLTLLTVLLCSCGTDSASESGYTFTDDLGRTVTVTSHNRTAVLLGSYADMWCLAGGSVCASADDAWEDFNLDISSDAVNLGGTKNLSFEGLLSARPDFVLASTNTPQHLEWQQNLENAGITVAYFNVLGFNDYLRMFKICTDITGNHEAYDIYGTQQKAKIDEIIDRNADKPAQRVLVLRVSAGSIRAKNSEGTVLGEMLSDFGCENIADSDKSLLENLSTESIALANPDRIFLVQVGDDPDGTRRNVENMFAENPLWGTLDAVKNNRVHYMEKRLYNLKPNAHWAEAYEKLEEILYAQQ